MTDDEKFWLVAILGALVILLAIAMHYAQEKWRLVAAATALLGSTGLAATAIHGPVPDMVKGFGAESVLLFKLVAAAAAAWAAYLGVDQIRAWWRHGDRDED